MLFKDALTRRYARVLRALLKRLNQPVKKGRLRFLQFAPRFFQRKEAGLIDFWKTLHLSRAWRPLHFEIVRANLEAIRQISLEGPGVNSLAAFLLYPSEIDPIAVRSEFPPLLRTPFAPGLADLRPVQFRLWVSSKRHRPSFEKMARPDEPAEPPARRSVFGTLTDQRLFLIAAFSNLTADYADDTDLIPNEP